MEHVHYSKDDHGDHQRKMDDWQREWEIKHPIRHKLQQLSIKVMTILNR